MAGIVSGFGLSHIGNAKNGVVLGKIGSPNLMLCRNGDGYVSLKAKERLLVMCNMSQSQAEPQSSVATTMLTKEESDVTKGKDIKVLETNYTSKADIDGSGEDVLDGSGGNGKYVGGGSGGGGGGDDGEANDYEEEEFGPIMKFEEVIKEVETQGASLPSDMLEAAKSVGIRKLLLQRYLELQGSIWPVGFAVKSCAMIRNRMLADPAFLFKIGTEIEIDSCCATFAEVQKRGKDFWQEFELYVADLLVGVVVNVALVGMLAPYVRIGKPSVSKGFLGRMQTCLWSSS